MPIPGFKYNLNCVPDSPHVVDSLDEEMGYVWFYKEGESKHLLWKSSIYAFKNKFMRAELVVGDRVACFNMDRLIGISTIVEECADGLMVDDLGYTLNKKIGIGGTITKDNEKSSIVRRLYTPELEEHLDKKKMINEMSIALSNAAQVAKSNLLMSLSKAELEHKKELIMDFINENLKS